MAAGTWPDKRHLKLSLAQSSDIRDVLVVVRNEARPAPIARGEAVHLEWIGPCHSDTALSLFDEVDVFAWSTFVDERRATMKGLERHVKTQTQELVVGHTVQTLRLSEKRHFLRRFLLMRMAHNPVVILLAECHSEHVRGRDTGRRRRVDFVFSYVFIDEIELTEALAHGNRANTRAVLANGFLARGT